MLDCEIDFECEKPISNNGEKKYIIYNIKKYCDWLTKKINEDYEMVSLEKLKKLLEKKQGYHFRCDPKKKYILYGDVDHYKKGFNKFKELYIPFMKEYYDIEINDEDIMYTSNKGKEGSYHYSVPKYNCTASKQKEMNGNFFKKHADEFYNKIDNEISIDRGVYTTRFFRYPNQLKENKKDSEHIIKKGEIIDFIVEHIPNNSINVETKKYIDIEKLPIIKSISKNRIIKDPVTISTINNINNTNNTNSIIENIQIDKKSIDEFGTLGEDNKFEYTIDDIEKLIGMLNISRCNDYNDWLNVGFCLYNINKNYMLIWDKWSRLDNNYEEGCCEKKWKTFRKKENLLTIGSLLLWAKTDNPNGYEDYMQSKKREVMILSKYPNDKIVMCESKKVGNSAIYTKIKTGKCLIKGCVHEDMKESMYIEMIDKFMTIKCRHDDCFGLTYYPNGHLSMTKNEMNIFYGNVTININNNNENELLEFGELKLYDDNELNKLLTNCLNDGSKHGNCADVLFYMYKNMYNYGEDDNWYKFDGNKWKNIGKKNMELRKRIKTDLVKCYKEILKDHIKADDEKKWSYLYGSMKSLEDTQFKNNIMTELIESYVTEKNSNRDFVKKLDKNRTIIGFENGVYDLEKFEFRKGLQEDYISMTTGYNYNENYTEHKDELMRFLEDILPDKLERDYMLRYLSTALVGNTLELFTVMTNANGRVGRNGKSKLIELLGQSFGEYFASIKSQIFTRPCPDANSPDPGLLNLINKRIVVASEPAKGEKLNVGFIKFITGRDSATLRNCHSNDMVEFTGNFVTLLACNTIPDCDDIDGAFSKRLRCVNFPMEFVDNPVGENQKKINVNINKNFNNWRQDFMLLLLEEYKIYIRTGELRVTDEILKWTNQYKENTDMYLQFLNECTEESDEHISMKDLYDEFKRWFRNNDPNCKIPSNRIFVPCISKYKEIKHVRIYDQSLRGIENLKLKE